MQNIDAVRLKHFMRHASEVARLKKDEKEKKEAVQVQLKKVSTISRGKPHLYREMKKLESMVGQVLLREEKIIASGEKETADFSDVKKRIDAIDAKLKAVEYKLLRKEQLNSELEALRGRLSEAMESRHKEDIIKFDDVSSKIGKIGDKIAEIAKIRAERTSRIEAIESGVKESSNKTLQEILRVEDMLKNLEMQCQLVKKEEKAKPHLVERIEERIRRFREKVGFLKRREINKAVKEAQESRINEEELKIADERFIPMPPKESKIRHVLKFGSPQKPSAVETAKAGMPSFEPAQKSRISGMLGIENSSIPKTLFSRMPKTQEVFEPVRFEKETSAKQEKPIRFEEPPELKELEELSRQLREESDALKTKIEAESGEMAIKESPLEKIKEHFDKSEKKKKRQ